MTLVVPFDGSELAEAALVRAGEFGVVFEEDVLAVSVIPNGNVDYARDRGWLDPEDQYELDAIVATLHEHVTEVCPFADFRHETVDPYAPAGAISRCIREVARNEDAAMVFIGSENAGHLVTGVSSIGRSVAADDTYDVVIVRHRSPAKIAKLKHASPKPTQKSDFYLPD